jgi:hypothetical protein
MKDILFILVISFILQSCLAKRTLAPKLTGYVYDSENRTPVAGCKVNGVVTDSSGFYNVKWIGYREFTFMGIEGPNGPGSSHARQLIQDKIIIEKNGFYPDTIKIEEPFGKRMRKGDYWKMDTLFLKSTGSAY